MLRSNNAHNISLFLTLSLYSGDGQTNQQTNETCHSLINCDGTLFSLARTHFSLVKNVGDVQTHFTTHNTNKQWTSTQYLHQFVKDIKVCDASLCHRSNSLLLLLSHYHHSCCCRWWLSVVFFMCVCDFSCGRKCFSNQNCMWYALFSHNAHHHRSRCRRRRRRRRWMTTAITAATETRRDDCYVNEITLLNAFEGNAKTRTN